MNEDISFCGRVLTAGELDLIRQIITDFPHLSQAELARTVCELLGWRRPNGGLKNRECVEFLRKLQHRDCLPNLPPLRRTKTPGPHALRLDAHSDPQPPLRGPLAEFQPLRLQLIAELADRRLFQQYIQRYHPLGYRVPYGAQLRYFVHAGQNSVLACLLFTSAAWKMAPRDEWIGWTDAARRKNLPRVVNNARFLVLPWVEVPHLASHILALAARRLPADWLAAYGLHPLLLETLVERPWAGTCYRAANWIPVGQTQGRGRMDRTHQRSASPKDILLYPLDRHWRERLCRLHTPVDSDALIGAV